MAHTEQFNRQRVGSWIVLGLLVVMVLFSSRLCAQDENVGSQPTSARYPQPRCRFSATATNFAATHGCFRR